MHLRQASLRRTHHDVKAGILKSCAFEGLRISHLMAFQNLSYKVVKPILTHLLSCKLVEYETDKRGKLVKTTEDGIVAFQVYEHAIALLEGRKISMGTRKTSMHPSQKLQAI
ncbi:MAG TPA: winged helix-turn-helix domain-containing protein [Candidatus Bathyarchaeia archaeon]|nr:winged helix-turn-helix domain-containing protein [Candidatus Bathyarchaeia archaeon]